MHSKQYLCDPISWPAGPEEIFLGEFSPVEKNFCRTNEKKKNINIYIYITF